MCPTYVLLHVGLRSPLVSYIYVLLHVGLRSPLVFVADCKQTRSGLLNESEMSHHTDVDEHTRDPSKLIHNGLTV